MQIYFRTLFFRVGILWVKHCISICTDDEKTIEGIIASLYIESELSLFLNDKYLLTEYLLAFSEFIPIVYKEKK